MKNTIKRAISIITLMSVLTMVNIQSTVKAATSFSDVKSTAWYYDYVNKLADLKITSGTGNNRFSPNDSVTRAEFVTFLCKVKGYEQTKGDPFIDTQKHWSTGYVTIALNNGIMDLPNDKKFKPNTAITRLQAVEMLCRALGINSSIGTTNPYTDVKPADTGYTNAAYINYLMVGSLDAKGKRVFKPSDKLTRGEVASLIVNAYNYNSNRIGFLNDKATEEYEKAKAEQEKAAQEQLEKQKYEAWLNSLPKGISEELLKNTDYLGEDTLYEANKKAMANDENTSYFINWGKRLGMTPEQVQERMIYVGTVCMNAFVNENYKNIDAFNSAMKEAYGFSPMDRYLKEKYDYINGNTIVTEGKFTTSKGLFTLHDGMLELRGTVRFRYLKPTSQKVLNNDVIKDTGKPAVIGTWYEQDATLSFVSDDGIKCSMITYLDKARIAK